MFSGLTKLNFHDGISLLVHVNNFSINNNNIRCYGLDGSLYNLSGHSEIKGVFTIDSVNNDSKVVSQISNNIFNYRPILEYSGESYELALTSINWNFNLTYDEIFGRYHQCRCEFLAFRTTDVDKIKNRVIWDSGCKSRFDDLQELIGSDVNELAHKAIELIDRYKFFTPSEECPTPSYRENATFSDDVAAIIAGTKPAVVFAESFLSNDDLLLLLLKEANARGFKIETVNGFAETKSIVVGHSYPVSQIVQIINQAVRDNAVNDYYYERLGDLIGLPTETIQKFNKNIKDFGFNRL